MCIVLLFLDPEHWTGSGGLNRSVPIALTEKFVYKQTKT